MKRGYAARVGGFLKGNLSKREGMIALVLFATPPVPVVGTLIAGSYVAGCLCRNSYMHRREEEHEREKEGDLVGDL